MAMYGNSTGVTSHRSMGIMQELQKYIAHVESLANHRKLEIEKLHEEKQNLEKVSSLFNLTYFSFFPEVYISQELSRPGRNEWLLVWKKVESTSPTWRVWQPTGKRR